MEVTFRPLPKDMVRTRLILCFGEERAIAIMEQPYPFILPVMNYSRMELLMFVIY